MKVQVKAGDVLGAAADLLVVNLFEGTKRPGGATGAVDRAVGGAVSAAVADGDFKGELGETLLLRPPSGIAARRLLVLGLGKKEEIDGDRVRQAMLPAMRIAKKVKAATVASVLHGAGSGGLSPFASARAAALGALLSDYEYDAHKSRKGHRVSRLLLVEGDGAKAREAAPGAAEGLAVGEAANWTRDLVASPPAFLRPDAFAKAAAALQGGKVAVKVLGEKELRAMKAGGILAVGQGSSVPPRLVAAEYRGGGKGAPWTVLVGKGVTFDTGGISLKKPEGMDRMKYDMAGGAAVLGALRAASALSLPLNVAAVVPMAENMPSGSAYRPGDVLHSLSGKTIEVLNTDAEGRLILADALHYAREKYRPAAMVDAATLTGACTVALGTVAMALMGNDAALVSRLKEASAASGEKAWELPMYEEFREQIKGDSGDIKNTGGPEAGTITAGWFLREFVGDTPWAHLDIAGVAWREKERMGYAPGPTAAPLRLFVEFLLAAAGRKKGGKG
jgi:leucyl aminopeptidase